MTALHDEHAAALFSFVLRYVDDRDRARDVVQETLLRAWRHLDRIDPRLGDPRSYLYTVARNVVTDQWRAAERRPRLVWDDTAVEAAADDDGLDAAVQGWMVAEGVQRLSPGHQAVIAAVYYQGRSVAEAAAVLGLPEGTIKSRCFYAVRALRAIFEEMGMVR